MLTGHRKRRRRLSAVGMFVVVMFGTLALLVFLRAVHTVAQDGLPTPEGRLGGAISIATQPLEPALPTPTPVTRLDIPDPELCDVEPRTVAAMLALVESPVTSESTPQEQNGVVTTTALTPASADAAEQATATVRPTATAAESDRPATAAIVGQIQRTVREIVACGNAGDLLSVWAYFSDDFVRASAVRQPALFNSTILTARARAQASRTDAMPRVTDVRLLSDDRVSALVTIPTASPFSVVAEKTGTVTVIFAQDNNAWRVDEVRETDGTGG